MRFKNVIKEHPAIHYVYDRMQIVSPLGRAGLMDMPFLTNVETLQHELDLVESMMALRKVGENQNPIRSMTEQLRQLNDIRPTVAQMANGAVLDDIQFFEIKKTAIISRTIASALSSMACSEFPLDDVDGLIDILDPERTGIPHFYIYSAYSETLSELREQLKKCEEPEEKAALMFREEQEEDAIRAMLTQRVGEYRKALSRNLETLAHLDVVMAKAALAEQWHACRPQIANYTECKQLFNPQVAEVLSQQGKRFQPVDIRFARETVLITGANMAGKSVLLKTLALAQYLFQFAFFVPATSATMAVVDEVITSIGDNQSELSGLSSFATEILTVDHIIRTGREGLSVLALVDELARTTNPEEGKRLVSAFVKIARQLGITAVITTHYGGVEATCRRLRVKGLTVGNMQKVTVHNLSDYMDYSLVETADDEVPKEALTIAEMLGVDGEFLQFAKECQ